ncbi:putative T6SS immunity periplasmic lipoprotein [Kalamiella sp. sgz302252]|uniref:putative T6SS immunity periplasmic lipoprotein n=1 Tax=Pantoea sp. sgz302252 TaxID=3341827 RepID=UPI0036D3E2B5
MVIRKTFTLVSTLLLTGCSGEGDLLRPDEEGTISVINKEVCFAMPDSKSYKLSILSIHPRGISYKEEKIVFTPAIL